MLISILFPFADSRGFLPQIRRIYRPNWPYPEQDKEFVRYFGSIKRRPLGGVADWDESKICEADRAVRFKGDLRFFDPQEHFELRLRCAYRRFYFDGEAMGKFEVGFAQTSLPVFDLSKDITRKLIYHVLRFPVRVRIPPDSKSEKELINIGDDLASSYMNATMAQDFQSVSQHWWVRSGIPQLFLHSFEGEKVQLPYRTKWINLPTLPKLELFQCIVPFRGKNIRMWVFNSMLEDNPMPSKHSRSSHKLYADFLKERSLRICLLRLHAEHECLRLILSQIRLGNIEVTPRSQESENLQVYFKDSLTRISETEAQAAKRFSSEITVIAREAINFLNPGECDALINALQRLDIRKNLLHEVVNYIVNLNVNEEIHMENRFEENKPTYNLSIGDNSTVSGVVQGENNTVISNLNASGQTELAETLKTLTDAVLASKNLPDDKKQEQVQVINQIGKEASGSQPNKTMLKILVDGLMATLKAVPDIVGVVTAVEPVLTHLHL